MIINHYRFFLIKNIFVIFLVSNRKYSLSNLWYMLKSDIQFFSILIINSQMHNQSGKLKFPEGLTKRVNQRQGAHQSGNRNLQMLSLLMRNSSVDMPQLNQDLSDQPPQYPRTESHGNLFTGTIAEEPARISDLRQRGPQSYAMECLEYEKYLFDNRIKLIIKRMSIKAYNLLRDKKQSPFYGFPIQKLLTTISKKLLLNRFELLFLEYVFEQTKWKYDIECIKKHAPHFNSFILLSDSESSNKQIRYMQIYILYCAYYSKKSLNELPVDNIFNELFNQLCPKFKDQFPEWTQHSSMPSKINPKTLNNIFKKLTYHFDRDHQEAENYSLIVEEIIDISPAYNADKQNKEKKKGRKKRQPQREVHHPVKPEQNSSQRDQPRFEEILQHDSDVLGEIPFKSKKSSFVSNVDPLDPRHYIQRRSSHLE